MTEIRKLTDEEVRLTEKSIANIEKEVEWLFFQQAHKELMVKEGLRINYERQLIKHNQELKEIKDALSQAQATLTVARDQIINGVKVKEKEE